MTLSEVNSIWGELLELYNSRANPDLNHLLDSAEACTYLDLEAWDATFEDRRPAMGPVVVRSFVLREIFKLGTNCKLIVGEPTGRPYAAVSEENPLPRSPYKQLCYPEAEIHPGKA